MVVAAMVAAAVGCPAMMTDETFPPPGDVPETADPIRAANTTARTNVRDQPDGPTAPTTTHHHHITTTSSVAVGTT